MRNGEWERLTTVGSSELGVMPDECAKRFLGAFFLMLAGIGFICVNLRSSAANRCFLVDLLLDD